MKAENIISTKSLSIGYSSKRNKHALIKNININIPKGKLTAVIGLNGAGKSTFIKTLAKQLPKLSGDFYVNNKNATLYSNNDWAKTVSWVQTNTETALNITVEEYISLGRQPYTNWFDQLASTDINIINTVIKNADLKELRKKNCNELSDGQLQRVTIARALVQDTEVIILDEPTTHLDIINKINTLNLLKELCEIHGKTIVFTTHEIEFALQTADCIVGISKNNVFMNSTKTFINKGILNQLFESENLMFNKESGRFIIK